MDSIWWSFFFVSTALIFLGLPVFICTANRLADRKAQFALGVVPVKYLKNTKLKNRGSEVSYILYIGRHHCFKL